MKSSRKKGKKHGGALFLFEGVSSHSSIGRWGGFAFGMVEISPGKKKPKTVYWEKKKKKKKKTNGWR